MDPEPRKPYRVEPAGALTQQLNELSARAAARGIRNELVVSLREIIDHLSEDPVGWGERKWRYKAAGLVKYQRLHRSLSVHYAVTEVHKVVFWTECKAVLDHPLARS